MALTSRHIQNMSEAAALEPHWGYADRAVPCTNDARSCAYLDVVYAAHDRGMTYTAVLWLTIGGILFLWALSRRVFPARTRADDLLAAALSKGQQPPSPTKTKTNTLTRLRLATLSLLRTHLLPTTPLPTLFGRTTTRLQLLTLAILTAYLTLWSFLGITYSTWITPIKNTTPQIHNTRTSLGPWADRVGVLAYALTPLSVLLASRESLLSLLTGIPYTSFLFLHRWTGYIILVQALLHTLGWVLVEAWLYRPQPAVWQAYAAQEYAVWGFVALGVLVLMVVLSVGGVVRRVGGYEVFRKVHYVLAMVYIGALIGHWKQLQCFLVPGLLLWGVDRGVRLVRMGLLHYGYWEGKGWGFRAVEAHARVWKGEEGLGDVVRLEFEHAHKPWAVGQHFFLCFVEGSIWQSHPFTPLSLPVADAVGRVKHTYIFRAKGGETKRIAEVLARKTAEEKAPTTPVILQGPYGEDMVEGLTRDVNVLCIAGGTGITYVLPVLLRLVRERPNPGRRMELVWAVKRKQDLEWVEPELDELRRLGVAHGLQIRTFVTAEPVTVAVSKEVQVTGEKGRAETDDESGSVQDAPSIGGNDHRPDVTAVVGQFVGEVAQGQTRVFGSGPPGMIVDLRAAVAKNNSGGRVWKGEERFNVRLVCDDRLE